ncbi:sensor domain-containing protein [Haloarchaeobius sp. DFWS5]|uniref:sensor domain-containing protein n=1 Tax=Haloarchaeobius sp. DFWS5 TaxID=3446114 RepID=UPI003EBD2700
MHPNESTAATDSITSGVVQFVAAPFRRQTYKNLLYLALAFPLGLAYFVGLVVGGSVGGALLITIVGLPILLVTIAAATVAAGFEAKLATHLGGVDAQVPSFLREFDARDELSMPGNGFVDAVKRLLTAPTTWTSVVLLLAKFVFGIAAFVALVFCGAVSVVLLGAPFIYDDPNVEIGLVADSTVGEYTIGPWLVDTLPEALAVAGVGVVFVFVALNLLNLLALLHATYTASILRVGNDPR